MKLLSKAFIATAVASLLLLSSTVALAASPTDVTVGSGGLLLATSSTAAPTDPGVSTGSAASNMQFEGATINMAASTILPVAGTDYIRVDDNTGLAEGWNVTVKADPLTSTINDPTTGAGTIAVSIPINDLLEVEDTSAVAVVNGSGSDTKDISTKDISGPSNDSPMSAAGVSVLSAADGYGAGAYTQDLGYTLTLPNYLPILGTTVTPSGDDIGTTLTQARATSGTMPLLAGTYSTTITYSVAAAGPQS